MKYQSWVLSQIPNSKSKYLKETVANITTTPKILIDIAKFRLDFKS